MASHFYLLVETFQTEHTETQHATPTTSIHISPVPYHSSPPTHLYPLLVLPPTHPYPYNPFPPLPTHLHLHICLHVLTVAGVVQMNIDHV